MNIVIKTSCRNEKLQGLRQAAGMSQSQMAKKAGIKLQVYQHYEQGAKDVSRAQLSTLLKICNALGCRLSDVVTDEETVELLKKYER